MAIYLKAVYLKVKMKLKTIRKLVQDLANANTMSGQIAMDVDNGTRKLTSSKITKHVILIMNAIREAENELEYLEEELGEWII